MPEINGIFPVFMIPTTDKSQYLYEKIFYDIKNILYDNKIDYTKISKNYMMDFE